MILVLMEVMDEARLVEMSKGGKKSTDRVVYNCLRFRGPIRFTGIEAKTSG